MGAGNYVTDWPPFAQVWEWDSVTGTWTYTEFGEQGA